mgnify:CR=1 FL=1
MNYILFDGPSRNDLLPLTFTRPVADLRIGILTIREKWEKMLTQTGKLSANVIASSVFQREQAVFRKSTWSELNIFFAENT